MKGRALGMMMSVGLSAILAAGCGGSSGGPSAPTTTGGTGSVTGSVKDDAGAGIGGATVQLSGSGKTTKSTTTGSDGSYTFSSVATGIWQVSVIPPTGYSGGSFPTVSVTSGGSITAASIILTKQIAGTTPTSDNVTIYLSAFAPQSVTIKAGGTVTWRNNDDIAHTATGTGFDTGILVTGQSSTKTFATPGTYNYACSIHSFMTGKVVVLQ